MRTFVALPATISAGDCDWKKRSSGLGSLLPARLKSPPEPGVNLHPKVGGLSFPQAEVAWHDA